MSNQPSTWHRAWIRTARYAPMLIAGSFLARLIWALCTGDGFNLVDLHVYVEGPARLLSDGLYDFTYSKGSPDFPLPFTYPPFAAIVFYPLHFLPFVVVGVAWELLIVAALYACIRIVLSMLLGERAAEPQWRATAMLWTAIGMWTEPVRTTLDYGQVNVFLLLCSLLAVRSSRWWISGTLVGLAAGIKLTPAITGLYFLARRRWAAAAWAAVAFGITVVMGYLVAASEAHRYFGTLLGDPQRIGPVGSFLNQSVRGAITHLVGRDVGGGGWWIGAIAVVGILGLFAWRALPAGDAVGTLLMVQIFGLMMSPISWSHHFVWLIPVILWLLYGPVRHWRGARVFAGYWIVITLIGVPWVINLCQESIWVIPRASPISWLGSAYALGAIALYIWLICTRWLAKSPRPVDQSPVPVPDPVG